MLKRTPAPLLLVVAALACAGGCITYVDMQDPNEIMTALADDPSVALHVQGELFKHYRVVFDNVLTSAGVADITEAERQSVVDTAVKAGFRSRYRSLRDPDRNAVKKADMMGFLRLGCYYRLYPARAAVLAAKRTRLDEEFAKRGLADIDAWKPVTAFKDEKPLWAKAAGVTIDGARVLTVVKSDYAPNLVAVFDKALTAGRGDLGDWAKREFLSDNMSFEMQRKLIEAIDAAVSKPDAATIGDIWYDFDARRFYTRVGFAPADLKRTVNELKRRFNYR